MGLEIFAYEIESIVIDTFIHVGEMAWKSPYYVGETLIDLATGHEAHDSHWVTSLTSPLPMGGPLTVALWHLMGPWVAY
jgi:hypothetical protein